MKKIITAGCSFTRYKWPTWSNYVEWFEPGYHVVNVGASGSSNETIMRSVYNAVNKWKNVEKVYVMWSEPNRYEVLHDKLDPTVKKDESVTYSRWDKDFEWNTFYGGHYYKDKHEYYVRHFQNERQNNIRTLERILFTQMFLENNNIEYKMMCYKSIIVVHNRDQMTNGQRALYDRINWKQFIFHNEFDGLNEFAEQQWPEQFNKPTDEHPLPLAHYHWVKDVMYKSDILCPAEEYEKMKEWKI